MNNEDYLEQKLKECRVSVSNARIPNPPPLLSFQGIPLFTRGNISTIVGPPKCGKTMILSFLTAVLLDPTVGKSRFDVDSKYPEILFFDTEQAVSHSNSFVKRILSMVNSEFDLPNLNVYRLRDQSINDRLNIINYGITRDNTSSFVVIDGIGDLVDGGYNDEANCIEIVNKLMRWSEQSNCHICTVIHSNKSSKEPNGHLGSHLKRKSENVFSVEKKSNNIFLKSTEARDIAISQISLQLNSEGIPELMV